MKSWEESDERFKLEEIDLDKVRSGDINNDLVAKMLHNLLVYQQELEQQNEALRMTHLRLNDALQVSHSYFEDAPLGYLICNERGQVLLCNEAATNMFNVSRQGMINKDLRTFIDESCQDRLYFCWREASNEGKASVSKIKLKCSLNEIYVKVIITKNNSKDPPNYRVAFLDITSEVNYMSKIQHLNYHDGLTGLHNSRFVEMQLARYEKEKRLPLTVILADVDGLKLINDTFGHSEGDRLIQTTGRILKEFASDDDVVARRSGDEFIIVSPDKDAWDIKRLVAKIRSKAEKITLNDIPLSISLGWSIRKSDEEPISKIVKEAEDKMYAKKLADRSLYRDRILIAVREKLYNLNSYEQEHAEGVAYLAEAIAKKIGLDENQVSMARTAGLLHDIGKIAIENEILEHNRRLSNFEKSIVQSHCEMGYRLLNSIFDMNEIARIVLSHHERVDGRGYPYGLKGNQIAIISKILCISDALDSMISDRPFRSKLSLERVLKELKRGEGKQFDEEIVKVIINMTMDDKSELSAYIKDRYN